MSKVFRKGPRLACLTRGHQDTEGFDEMLGMALTDGALEIKGCSNGAEDRAVDVEGTLDGAGTLDDWAVGQSEMLGRSDL